MNNLPIWGQISVLLLLLVISAFFSISETSMMSINRYRLRHLVKAEQTAYMRRGVRYTQELLCNTDKLLTVILIGNNVINTALPILAAELAIYYLGASVEVIAITTAIVAFLIIVVCEIFPKIIGAHYAEKIAFSASYILKPLVWLARPLIWFINIFVGSLFKILGISLDKNKNLAISADELRSLIQEAGNFIPRKHQNILLNLFDVKNITVDDVMTPKAKMEIIDIDKPLAEIGAQLATCYHNTLPVCQADRETMIGFLHFRKILFLLGNPIAFNKTALRDLLTPMYYIPSGTLILQQLQYFQENRQRLGLIVNEYGEVQGLVSPEDIIEEIIGQFAISNPEIAAQVSWDKHGHYLADASVSLRDLNRQLSINLPTPAGGPKTLNGLLLEYLQEIPDASVSVKIEECAMDILHIDNQVIKTVRIYKP